jgi:hypothetical protein
MSAENSALLLLCLFSVGSVATVCDAEDAKQQDKVLRHAVFFKFKDDTSAEDVAKVVEAFGALPKKIDSIKDYQAGKNVSPIGFDDGFTHCFLVTQIFATSGTQGVWRRVATALGQSVCGGLLGNAGKISEGSRIEARLVFEVQRYGERGRDKGGRRRDRKTAITMRHDQGI